MNYYLGPYQWIDNSYQPPLSTVGSIDLRNLTHMGTPAIQDGYGFFATIDPVAGYDLLGQGDLREINSTGSMKSMWNSLLGYNPDGDKLVDLLYDQLTMGADPTGVDSARPLMPAKGNLTVHLHGRVKATQFRLGHSPESNKVLSVLREDYREIRNLVLEGNLPVNHHRKVLDFWGNQFKIKNPQQIFIPNNLPIETPIPHDTSISENFDGANNAAIGKQLTWVEGGDGSFWDNFDNHGRHIDDSSTNEDERACYVNSALSSADHRCTATLVVLTAIVSAEGGVVCRRSNSAITYYTLKLNSISETLRINKVVAGTSTGLGSNTAVTMSIPDTLKLEINGSDLEGFFNGVSKITLTDAAIPGNLFCGLRAFLGVGDAVEFDTWSAEDIITSGGPGASPLLMGLL